MVDTAITLLPVLSICLILIFREGDCALLLLSILSRLLKSNPMQMCVLKISHWSTCSISFNISCSIIYDSFFLSGDLTKGNSYLYNSSLKKVNKMLIILEIISVLC